MPFQPEKITKADILEAVEMIETDNPKLHPSTKYDVIIKGKRYPPKEIIRFSHKIATGDDPGLIYGGFQVNEILIKLGFQIESKISVWKLGCHWGKGAPSFYSYIVENQIVFGHKSYNYRIGDLILITEGFTVLAIGKVIEEPVSILNYPDLYERIRNFWIPYEGGIITAKIEIHQLSITDIFTYQLQQGIREVRSQFIINKAVDIWENRNSKLEKIVFYSKEYNQKPNSLWKYPCFVLQLNSWNDYSYRTSFDLYFYRDQYNVIEIGQTKILKRENVVTPLMDEFKNLDSSYCSLGQTIAFYKRLKSEFPTKYLTILKVLRDCAIDPKIKNKFANEDGFRKSLLRASETELIIKNINDILEEQILNLKYEFEFHYKIDTALKEHTVDFGFNHSELANRFFCIIGKNATGKTRFLSQLANKLADDSEDGLFVPNRPQFSKIIVASFSFFDKFRFPKANDTNYEFIGIKDSNGIIAEEKYSDISWKDYKIINEDLRKKSLWITAINSSLETDFINFDLNDLLESNRSKFISKTEMIFSSGQNIVFQFITRCIRSIEDNSLLIFDEPETHLHPNIAGRLLKTINNILTEFNSFSILSTHSPIIVQEIPSKFIRIFDRQNNYPLVYPPTIECFGENLSVIANAIFKVEEEKELYKEQLDEMAIKLSFDEINKIFDKDLSLNARLYLKTISK